MRSNEPTHAHVHTVHSTEPLIIAFGATQQAAFAEAEKQVHAMRTAPHDSLAIDAPLLVYYVGADSMRTFAARIPAIDEATLYISTAVWSVLGLDDRGRYPDVVRSVYRSGYDCTGTRSALQTLVDEIYDRATEGENGFNESGANKRACRAALAQLRKRGWTPRT